MLRYGRAWTMSFVARRPAPPERYGRGGLALPPACPKEYRSDTARAARVPRIRDVVSGSRSRYWLAVVRFIRDYRGQYLRLTDERLEHVVRQHPEAARLGVLAIEDALRHPDAVIVSPAAPDDRLYYRRHSGPDLGDKFLCVVVKSVDAFVVTAYVTAR
jgi:hypothetical protein